MENVGLNSVGKINNNYAPKAIEKENTKPVANEETKTFEVPKEAVDTMKASVLFNLNKKEDSEYKEYIPTNATPKEVRDVLADKKQTGRSFFGFKRAIKSQVAHSNNPEQTIENLNFLLNAENKKLNAPTINHLLSITEAINKGGKTGEFLQKQYGFEGGKLTEENFKPLFKKYQEVQTQNAILGMFLGQQMNQQMNQQMIMDMNNQMQLQNQLFQDQMMMQNQMMMQQTMMPPMM